MTSTTKTAPNPFDPAALRLTQPITAGSSVVTLLLVVPVQKPQRQVYVRVHPDPDFRLPIALLELKDERETYAVVPDVALQIPSEVKHVDLRLSVTQQGMPFLWPVPLRPSDRAENTWNMTARTAAEQAERDWVRVTTNMSTQSYDVHVAPSIAAAPVWPSKSMAELLEIAFRNGKLIDSLDHPVVQRLLGLI
jgi:hypothetical protein